VTVKEKRVKTAEEYKKEQDFARSILNPTMSLLLSFFSFHFIQGILRDIIHNMIAIEGLFNQNNQYRLDFFQALITLFHCMITPPSPGGDKQKNLCLPPPQQRTIRFGALAIFAHKILIQKGEQI
jgi:hypothetical protein